ncbi:MAG: hydantoinase/oxoprolinase family protein [Ectothiorhodospiraceae bacterium]|nr:hydantoinase/oxoprolinase family protein [Chromatiales bacterium]MCP5154955.1 hydantoinase/oxoprolinase family protein [Ectothiorhodospiraceae bacterium]
MNADPSAGIRLAVDIGGTFTDVVLEAGERRFTAKTLTTHDAPERGILTGFGQALAAARVAPGDVTVIIYGTTLATNLLIERKGAPTALVTTEGFRDSIEMRNENRYEQYDLGIDLPEPLVPRRLRLPVRERMNAAGEVLVPLDAAGVEALVPVLERAGVRSAAIGFLHSYLNSAHEVQARDILAARLPDVEFTLSSEVSPEMREYERLSTACANAYVQPLMSQHLKRLERILAEQGYRCPLFLMLSGGGITTLATAVRFPVRLVESGPAGGAIFASHIARELGLGGVVSYDMGGTTAKICLIDDGQPQTSRTFEVARVYRFMKGSGLPLRIPVIEMVEIGAGGGSIAGVDAMGRITVGPESAGSEPGPACYGRGGEAPTVTDADVVLGRIDPADFAGGSMALDRAAAERALTSAVGARLDLEPPHAALGVSEMVDENMANAARVHAIESGKVVEQRTVIAFGGAAPLHASRMAEKLGVARLVIPPGAGVGSAIGFLRAPVAYEVTRSHYQRLDRLEVESVNAMLDGMRAEAYGVVEPGAGGRELTETRTAFMRYVGQGHEVGVELPIRVEQPRLDADAAAQLRASFEREYHRLYERTIPDLEVEILTWVMLVSTRAPEHAAPPPPPQPSVATASGERSVLDTGTGEYRSVPVYRRDALVAGNRIEGPAVVVEKDTTTVVSARYVANVHPLGYLVLERKQQSVEESA